MAIHEFNSNTQSESLGSMQKQNCYRKFSFPATLHSASLLEVNAQNTRRRLSNVSDVVTRKLSYTIGWKAAHIPAQDIIAQGKCLCGQYIKRRLKRSGLFNKTLGLQKIRSILGTSSIAVVREVFPALMVLGDELERMHPHIYSGVARQICRLPNADLSSSETVAILITTLAHDLFQQKITWGKIISLFAVTSGLALDCVRQGHSDYLPKLLEAVADVIEDELVPWINENGGWIGLNLHANSAKSEIYHLEHTTQLVGGVFVLLITVIMIRFVGSSLLSFL